MTNRRAKAGAAIECFKMVAVRGGQAMAATRHCSGRVVYVDPQGRGWCRRHEPDTERKALWARIGKRGFVELDPDPKTFLLSCGHLYTTVNAYENTVCKPGRSCACANGCTKPDGSITTIIKPWGEP